MTEVESNVELVSVSVKEETKVEVTTEEKPETNGLNGHTNGDVVQEEAPTKANSEENGEVQKDEEVEAAATEGAGEIEEKKEEVPPSPPKVILHQFPPGRHVPSLSPFCLKLETYLRLNTIPYENHYGYKVGKKGKLPWIEYKGERKADSNLILPYLNETFEVNLDNDLSAEQLAVGRAVKSMVEENTYWALIYTTMIDNFNEFKKVVAPDSGAGIGFNIAMKMNQRRCRAQLDGQGMGRHSREEVYDIASKDIDAVSTLLGEKEFLFGDKPTSFDCSVFGLFANLLWGGVESPMSAHIKENAANIVSYCERMKALAWHDWSEMVLGEKPEPQLKKGFSFRKGKKKSKPAKEPEVTSEEENKDETPAAGGEEEAETSDNKKEETTEEVKPAESTEEKVEEKKDDAEPETKPAEESAPKEDVPAEPVAETPSETPAEASESTSDDKTE